MTPKRLERLRQLVRHRRKVPEAYAGERDELAAELAAELDRVPQPMLRVYLRLRLIEGLHWSEVSDIATNGVVEPDTIKHAVDRFIRGE